jgi:hypothetical protein
MPGIGERWLNGLFAGGEGQGWLIAGGRGQEIYNLSVQKKEPELFFSRKMVSLPGTRPVRCTT